jgi:hypothetical protein
VYHERFSILSMFVGWRPKPEKRENDANQPESVTIIQAATIAESSQTVIENSTSNLELGDRLAAPDPFIQSQALVARKSATGSQTAPTRRGRFLARTSSAFPPRHK